MIKATWKDVMYQYNSGDITTRIIVINCAVFVAINVVKLLCWLAGTAFFSDFLNWVSFHSDGWFNLLHPWVFVTNYFLHVDFMHLLGNMLVFSIAGLAASDTFGKKRILPIYFLGGLAGNFIYWLVATWVPNLGLADIMLGASASIMAVLLAATATSPEYRIRLFIFGSVPLKYLSMVLVFLDFVSIPDGGNTGGHLAHLGGAAIGFLIATLWKQGIDLTRPVSRFLQYIVSLWGQFSTPRPEPSRARPRPEKVYQADRKAQGNASKDTSRNNPSADEQAVLDTILDKIKQSGYESLSAEERETLFSASRK